MSYDPDQIFREKYCISRFLQISSETSGPRTIHESILEAAADFSSTTSNLQREACLVGLIRRGTNLIERRHPASTRVLDSPLDSEVLPPRKMVSSLPLPGGSKVNL